MTHYPRPVVTVDCAIVGAPHGGGMGSAHILFIERGEDPHKGMLALPGGHLEMTEEIADGALRELKEETNLGKDDLIIFEQIKAIGTLGRDPRDRYITVLHGGIIDSNCYDKIKAGDDAADFKWVPFSAIEYANVAFDHKELCKYVIRWFAGDSVHETINR